MHQKANGANLKLCVKPNNLANGKLIGGIYSNGHDGEMDVTGAEVEKDFLLDQRQLRGEKTSVQN